MTSLSPRVHQCISVSECRLTSFIIARLAPDTRPVTRTAWAELFDLIFRKPTTQGPRQGAWPALPQNIITKW